ncbi:unnamed protein product [Pedinophyceae sp. YPF-701]|nr:unnamed protein product [Pedinophyceae sp. YPF-701]
MAGHRGLIRRYAGSFRPGSVAHETGAAVAGLARHICVWSASRRSAKTQEAVDVEREAREERRGGGNGDDAARRHQGEGWERPGRASRGKASTAQAGAARPPAAGASAASTAAQGGTAKKRPSLNELLFKGTLANRKSPHPAAEPGRGGSAGAGQQSSLREKLAAMRPKPPPRIAHAKPHDPRMHQDLGLWSRVARQVEEAKQRRAGEKRPGQAARSPGAQQMTAGDMQKSNKLKDMFAKMKGAGAVKSDRFTAEDMGDAASRGMLGNWSGDFGGEDSESDSSVVTGKRHKKKKASKKQRTEDDAERKKASKAEHRAAAAVQVPEERDVDIPYGVTVAELASLLEVAPEVVEGHLRDLGDKPQSHEDRVPAESAELIAMELGFNPTMQPGSGVAGGGEGEVSPRGPVVTVMGHVDHGKTSLLDALRSTSVAAREAGGITQHVGAFEVALPGSKRSVTFLDTPGHAAFTSMRARGAQVTDIVVLAVAGDDGVMPQTREAIALALGAGTPIVVAVTKSDRPASDTQRVLQELAAEGVVAESLGGDVQVVETAAVKGVGLRELEECILTQADVMGLAAPRGGECRAFVIEAQVAQGLGPVATVVVRRGTLKVGQHVVVGATWGRVRSLVLPGGSSTDSIGPGQPALVTGLKGEASAGDELIQVDSSAKAQRLAEARAERREVRGREAKAAALQELAAAHSDEDDEEEGGVEGGELPDWRARAPTPERPLRIPVVVKADVQGSLEAVLGMLGQYEGCVARPHVVASGVGAVAQADLDMLAQEADSGAALLAFNVKADARVQGWCEQAGVSLISHNVIYHLVERLESAMTSALPRIPVEEAVGEAAVKALFPLQKKGRQVATVAGCKVDSGALRSEHVARFQVLRSGEVVWEGRCKEMRHNKDVVRTVRAGTECGVLLDGFDGVQVGDKIVCVGVERRPMDLRTGGPAAGRDEQ